MKLTKIKLSLSGLLFFIILYLTSPIINLLLFKNALKYDNKKEFANYIDFPALRYDLKNQFITFLEDKTSARLAGDNLSELKILLITPIINNIVESAVNSTITPSGLEKVLNTGYISKRFSTSSRPNNQQKITNSDLSYLIYYKNLNTFVLETLPREKQTPVIAKWKRTYLLRWKLYSLKLPLN